jgi:hypothetical protein
MFVHKPELGGLRQVMTNATGKLRQARRKQKNEDTDRMRIAF